MNLIPGVRFASKVLNGAKLNETAVETFEPFAELSRNGLKDGELKLIGVIQCTFPAINEHVKKLYDDYKIPLIFSAPMVTVPEFELSFDDYYAKATPTVVTQMKPVYSILKKLHLKDVQIITYTHSFADIFENEANKEGITVTNKHVIEISLDECGPLANTFIDNTTTKAIYILYSPSLENCLFKFIQSKNTTKTFQWISTHVLDYKYEYKGLESFVNNLIVTNIPFTEKLDQHFIKYLENLRPENNKRNE
ncbi:hypothetical protein B4U80_12437, partial [Leptotrombidium deliense]